MMDKSGGGEDLMPLHLLSSMFAEYQLKGWNIVSSSVSDNALHVDFKFQTNEYSRNDAGASAAFAVQILQKLYTHLRVKRWTIVSNNRQIGLIHFSFTFEFRPTMKRENHRDLIPTLRGHHSLDNLDGSMNFVDNAKKQPQYPDMGRLVGILEDLKVANERSKPSAPYTTLIESDPVRSLPSALPPRSSSNSSGHHTSSTKSRQPIVELDQSDEGEERWPDPPKDQFILAPAASYKSYGDAVKSDDSLTRSVASSGRRVPAKTAKSVLSIPPPDYENLFSKNGGDKQNIALHDAREVLQQDRFQKYNGGEEQKERTNKTKTPRQELAEANVMRMFNGGITPPKNVSNMDMANAVEQYMSAALVSEESSVVDYRVHTATTTTGSSSMGENITASSHSGSTEGSKSVGINPTARVQSSMEHVELLCSMCHRPKTSRLAFKPCKHCNNLYCPDCVWWCIVSRKGRCVQCYYHNEQHIERGTGDGSSSQEQLQYSLAHGSNSSKGSHSSNISKISKGSKTSSKKSSQLSYPK